ncbi:LOW QUALITY PROTEIN: hypothetical protein PHMEG_00029034, partial [Phytophthora megakarya]
SAETSSKSKKSCSKKTGAKAKSCRPASDEYVISVSAEFESESSSDQDSSASEGSEAHEDEESKLAKLRPESQYPASSPAAGSQAVESSVKPTSKAKSASTTKISSKSSPKGKKKTSPKSAGKKKSSAKTRKVSSSKKKAKSQDATDESSLDSTLPTWISTYPELVKLAQRASDLLTPYVAPDFTTVSAQKYWVKLEQAYLPSPVPSDAEIKCTTVGIQKFWIKCTSDAGERRKFKVALERLKKVWFTYNKERADRADNLRTFLPGRIWPWCVGPDATLPIETLLDPTLPFYTIENLMWVLDWCAEAALMDKSEPCRVDWLTCPEQHPYNTVYVPCNAHVPLFLPANSTVEVLGPQIVPDSSLEPADIDPSWDRAFLQPTKMKRRKKVKL